jgi:signal peptidase I
MDFLRKVYAFLLDTVQSLLIVFAVFLVIWQFLFRPFQVSGNSMYPSFLDKEYIITNVIALRFNKLKVGDVIVFRAPPDPDRDYIKRVIGTPGDTVYLKDGDVYLNGNLLNQSAFLQPSVKTYGGSFLRDNATVTVPADSYFVMGDNRPGSSDSREWGFVPVKTVVGMSSFVYWPLSKMGTIKNPYN